MHVGTMQTGRGQRGITIDQHEFEALKNVLTFNFANPLRVERSLTLQDVELKMENKPIKLQKPEIHDPDQGSNKSKSFTEESILVTKYQEIKKLKDSIVDIERVKDWDQRISAYPKTVQKRYHIGLRKMRELTNLIEEKSRNWKLVIHDKENDVICEKRISSRGVPMIRVKA